MLKHHDLSIIIYTRTCIHVENTVKDLQTVEVEEPEAEY